MSAATERLEQDLEHDREHLRETLSALEQKMSPGQLLDEAMTHFGVGPKAFASTLGTQVRDNPLPVLLTGVGLAWLVMGSRSGGGQPSAQPSEDYEAWDASFDDADYEALTTHDRLQSAEWGCVRQDGETLDAYDLRLQRERATALELEPLPDEDHVSFGSRVSGAADAIRQKGASARDRMRRTAKMTKRGAGAALSGGISGAKGAAGKMKSGVGSAAGSAQALHQDNPFATAAIGVAVGAVLGALTPLTRQEQQVLAPVADKGLAMGSAGARTAADALADKVAPSEPAMQDGGAPPSAAI